MSQKTRAYKDFTRARRQNTEIIETRIYRKMLIAVIGKFGG